MAAFIFLGIGLLCAIISRVWLIGAAFGVSPWWGIGVCLPFGPLFFRLGYPDLARGSRLLRLTILPCVLLYLIFGPGLKSTAYYRHKIKRAYPPPPEATGYALESTRRTNPGGQSSGPQVELTPTIAERKAANAAEFERLRVWGEKLRIQKRDLLRSDAAGNRAYELELSQYNAALEQAIVEKATLDKVTK